MSGCSMSAELAMRLSHQVHTALPHHTGQQRRRVAHLTLRPVPAPPAAARSALTARRWPAWSTMAPRFPKSLSTCARHGTRSRGAPAAAGGAPALQRGPMQQQARGWLLVAGAPGHQLSRATLPVVCDLLLVVHQGEAVVVHLQGARARLAQATGTACAHALPSPALLPPHLVGVEVGCVHAPTGHVAGGLQQPAGQGVGCPGVASAKLCGHGSSAMRPQLMMGPQRQARAGTDGQHCSIARINHLWAARAFSAHLNIAQRQNFHLPPRLFQRVR